MLNELAYYAWSSLSSGIFQVPTDRQNKFLPKSVKFSWADIGLRWFKSSTVYFIMTPLTQFWYSSHMLNQSPFMITLPYPTAICNLSSWSGKVKCSEDWPFISFLLANSHSLTHSLTHLPTYTSTTSITLFLTYINNPVHKNSSEVQKFKIIIDEEIKCKSMGQRILRCVRSIIHSCSVCVSIHIYIQSWTQQYYS